MKCQEGGVATVLYLYFSGVLSSHPETQMNVLIGTKWF